MAFKKTLAQRLLNITKISNYRISSSVRSPNPAKPDIAPDPGDSGIFRRFLHKRPVFSSELRQPAAGSILHRLREMDIARSRIRLDGLTPPEKQEVGAKDVRKVLRAIQIETVKSKLRKIPESCIPYSDFMRMCVEGCSDPEQARSIAQMLDDSASVIILGDVVFLRPEQVAKTIQSILPLAGARTIESERKELEEMEKVKAAIDERANTLVRRELWAGLGFLVAQTLGFMRLTFWELSWDVMEPICFYVTSMYFMAGYTFFVRTSKEPCFEGFYQSRFTSKQKRLMKLHNFDIDRYKELKAAAAPSPPSFQIDTSFAIQPFQQFHKNL
ncbi:calcium uniporter protein 2, mitochondrial-like [Vigna umbellata]|uniref:calcium uniporter protein 2, mitochondrial-like n=1 Tax=Vigna umbellata TaxID=87088 RepID=UPI001F5E444D|nr:calcium uniporter protein 2, mitochondrial-like [Vigna umbellata]